jgi:oligosaccharide repeat unit polymerase
MISIGRRSSILAMIIPLLIYRHYFVARLSLKKAAIWGGLVFALLVGIAIFRILTAASRTELEATAIFASAEYFTWDMNMAVLDQTGGFVKFRDGLDFLPYWFRGLFDLDQYGVSFVSIGEMTVARYFPSFPAGIPAGIQGTLYMDWGWSGVVVGMWMMGVAARYWYEYLLCNLKSRLVVLLIYPVGLMAFFYLLRLGDFWLGFSAQIRFIVASIGLAFVLNRFRIVTRGIKKQNKMGNIKNHDLLPQRDLSQAC